MSGRGLPAPTGHLQDLLSRPPHRPARSGHCRCHSIAPAAARVPRVPCSTCQETSQGQALRGASDPTCRTTPTELRNREPALGGAPDLGRPPGSNHALSGWLGRHRCLGAALGGTGGLPGKSVLLGRPAGGQSRACTGARSQGQAPRRERLGQVPALHTGLPLKPQEPSWTCQYGEDRRPAVGSRRRGPRAAATQKGESAKQARLLPGGV